MKLLYHSPIENQKLLYKKSNWNKGLRYTKESRKQITSIMNNYKILKICKFCGKEFKPKHSIVFCSIKCLLKERNQRENLYKKQKKQLKFKKLKEKLKENIKNGIIQKEINPYELEKIEIELDGYYIKKFNMNIECKGIYFIFDKNNNLIYIGQTIHIIERIYQHCENSMWFKEFAKNISYVEYEGNLDEIEMKYILKYNTRFNYQSLNYDNSYTHFNWWLRYCESEEYKERVKKAKLITDTWK